MEVLGKWNNAVYVPPKLEQGFNQGGSFVFDGDRTVFAHYDESTAAHAIPGEMVKRVLDTANERATV